MDARLRRQHPERVATLDLHDRLVKADALARNDIELDHLPALVGGIVAIHAIEHLGPVLGLQAALAGVDGHDGVPAVEATREPRGHLEHVEHLAELGGGHCALLGKRVVFSGQLEGGLRVSELGGRGIVVRYHLAQVRRLLRDILGVLGVIPKARRRHLCLQLGQLAHLLVDTQEPPRVLHALSQSL